MHLTDLTLLSQLDEIDFRSAVRKQLIFKHSTRCFVSSSVFKRLKAELEKADEPPSFDIYYMDLIKHRDISNAIADRYQVHHESPQLLIIENAKCIHHASHNDVSLQDAGLIN